MEKRGLTGMGIWNTTDYKGQPVTWYSAEEIEKYKQALDKIEEIAKESPAIDSEFSLRVLEVIKEVK